jgi:hypothetical protein
MAHNKIIINKNQNNNNNNNNNKLKMSLLDSKSPSTSTSNNNNNATSNAGVILASFEQTPNKILYKKVSFFFLLKF